MSMKRECSDQTIWMYKLIWTYVAGKLYKGLFHAFGIIYFHGEINIHIVLVEKKMLPGAM